MACRGVYFAITDKDAARLLSAKSDDEVLTLIQTEIEEKWDEGWLCETDKAWDAIQRCLTNGKIGFENDASPYHLCVLGGRQLHSGGNYVAALKSPGQVEDIARVLRSVTEENLRQSYFNIDPQDYGFPISEEDFEYTVTWFRRLPGFFEKAAAAKRWVVFTVDQ